MTSRPRWTRRSVSLRRRLIIGMLALVTAGLIALGVTTYLGLENVLVKRTSTAIAATVQAAATTLTVTLSQSPAASPAEISAALGPLLTPTDILVFVPDSGAPFVVANPPLGGGKDLTEVLANEARHYPARPVTGGSIRGTDYQEAAQRIFRGTLVGAASLRDVDTTLRVVLFVEAIVGGTLLVVLASLGVFVVRRGLRPLDTIARTAAAITKGDRGQRIPVPPGDTEVGRVSAALNQMLDETEASFAAQRDSEARLRQFIADASHELRTPLASVRSYAELLRTGAAGTQAQRELAMNRIESESARMSELVEDLLLLARLDMGRPLRTDPVDLAELVRDTVEDENAIDPDRPRALSTAGPAWVPGDANRLRQVLVNLLANARMHTPPGTPVTIELSNRPGEVRLVVADEGPGLPPAQPQRVFERFYRADTARTHRTGGGSGVGLGLSIVAAIVTAHGGTVRADGQPGKGARFTVRLPAET